MMDRCDAIRDDLPLLAAGVLDADRARQVEQHLQVCEECGEEQSLIVLLRSPIAVPADLEGRLRNAVGRASAPSAVRRWRTAAAAAVAVIVVGASGLLVAQRRNELAVDITGSDAAVLGWAARVDPVLHGGIGLDALTDEELELLLAEMQT